MSLSKLMKKYVNSASAFSRPWIMSGPKRAHVYACNTEVHSSDQANKQRNIWDQLCTSMPLFVCFPASAEEESD